MTHLFDLYFVRPTLFLMHCFNHFLFVFFCWTRYLPICFSPIFDWLNFLIHFCLNIFSSLFVGLIFLILYLDQFYFDVFFWPIFCWTICFETCRQASRNFPGASRKSFYCRKTTKIQPQRLRIRPRAAVDSPCRLPRSECMASDINNLKTILCCYDSYVHWPGGPENMFLPLLLPVANYQRSILSSSRAPNNENGVLNRLKVISFVARQPIPWSWCLTSLPLSVTP